MYIQTDAITNILLFSLLLKFDSIDVYRHSVRWRYHALEVVTRAVSGI